MATLCPAPARLQTLPLWLALATLIAGAGCKAPKPPASSPSAAAAPPPAAQTATASKATQPTSTEALFAEAKAFSASRPVYEQSLGDGRIPVPGLPSLSSATCGSCHVEHLAEWKTSIHAAAWTDPQFVEERKKGAEWLCINCHTPLRVQHEKLVVSLVDGDVEKPISVKNPEFDANLQQEGITCAGFHVRNGAIHSADRANRAAFATHPVVKDSSFDDGTTLCLRCHQAVAEYPGKAFVCTFNTGNEYREGPYPAEGKTCVSCHMPEVTRSPAVGAPERLGHQHYWRGAGIPKQRDGTAPPLAANPPGLAIAVRVERTPTANTLVVKRTNARAGHRLPTGDPERFITTEIQFDDVSGAIVAKTSVPPLRQTWEWYPAPKKIDDLRLAPRASREDAVAIPPGAHRATIVATHHRMSREAAEYHHLEDIYPTSKATHRVVVDLISGKTLQNTLLP